MKMIRCIVRPEKEEEVIQALEAAGQIAFTKMDVFGRGRQRGVQIGATRYEELAKTMFVVVAEDRNLEAVVEAFKGGARTGHPGDGKIFVSEVQDAWTIRTGEKLL